MTERGLRNLAASTQVDDRWKATGLVEVRAIPTWLKGDRFVHADLTPAEARRLAIDLLTAADRAEGSQ